MRTTIVLIIAVFSLLTRAHAQTVTNRPLALDDCIQLALQFNLDVQIKRVSPLVDEFTLKSSLGAFDPNLNFNLKQGYNSSPAPLDTSSTLFKVGSSEFYTDSYGPSITGTLPDGSTHYSLAGSLVRNSGSTINGFSYSSQASISVTQPLLKNFWTDINRQTIELNKRTLKIDELALRYQIMSTVSAVQQAYYDLVYFRDNMQVQQASLALAEKLLAENKIRVNLGALAPLDEKQSESQVAARKADLLSAQRDLDAQQNALKSLLTSDFATWNGVNIQPTDKLVAVPANLNLQESWRRGIELRPDLQQTRETIEKQNIAIRYNHNQLFPQLDLNLTYGHNGLGNNPLNGLDGQTTGQNRFYSYGLVLSVPLNNTTAKNNYKASKAGKEQLILQLKQAEQQVIVAIDNAVKTAQSNYDKLEATRQARIYAELALEAEQKKLENGKSTSFVVLQLQRDLTSARSAEIRAIADYNKSLAALALSEGTTLEKANVKIEIK